MTVANAELFELTRENQYIATTIRQSHNPLSAQSASGDHDRDSQASAAKVSNAGPQLARLSFGACPFWVAGDQSD
jgi:hypothetical protein